MYKTMDISKSNLKFMHCVKIAQDTLILCIETNTNPSSASIVLGTYTYRHTYSNACPYVHTHNAFGVCIVFVHCMFCVHAVYARTNVCVLLHMLYICTYTCTFSIAILIRDFDKTFGD